MTPVESSSEPYHAAIELLLGQREEGTGVVETLSKQGREEKLLPQNYRIKR
jgi:hypothetical protein